MQYDVEFGHQLIISSRTRNTTRSFERVDHSQDLPNATALTSEISVLLIYLEICAVCRPQQGRHNATCRALGTLTPVFRSWQ
jgi:hypothetical protein